MDPSHVRHQTGILAEAFAKHEEMYRKKMGKVGKWREALIELATISAWDTQNRSFFLSPYVSSCLLSR